MEFQPGAQKKGFNEGGANKGSESTEKARAESGSSGGLGSCTLILASIAVRPLYRFGSRAILPMAFREGATCGTDANTAMPAAIAVVRSSRLSHGDSADSTSAAMEPSHNHRQLSCISVLGATTWKNRCARPSLFTSVPSDSAKVPAGSTSSAAPVVAFSR